MSDPPREPRDEDTVDDDLLAAALAAELQRFSSTGPVPSLPGRPPAARPDAPAARTGAPAPRAVRESAPPRIASVAPEPVSTDTGSTRRARIEAERAAARDDRARSLTPATGPVQRPVPPPAAPPPVQPSAPPTSLLQRLTEGPHPFTPPESMPPGSDAARTHGRRARRADDTGSFTGPVQVPEVGRPAPSTMAPATGPAAVHPVPQILTTTGPQPTVLPEFADRTGTAVGPTTGELRVVRMPVDEGDDEGVDDVVVGVPAVAASTASVPLPPVVEAPPSAVVGSGTGSVAVVAARVPPSAPRAAAFGWAGAFATPLTALLGFVLAGAGAGGAAPLLMVAGVALTVPALVRSVRRAAQRGGGVLVVARDAFGGAGGTAVAAVLVAVRLLVLVLVLLGIGGLASAYGARTGAVGEGAVPAVGAVLAPALIAAIAGLLPGLAARVVQMVLGVIGLAGFLFAALLVASAGGGTAVPGHGDVLAAVAALGFVGLVTTGTAADLVGRTRGFGSPARAAVGMVVATAVGLVLLVLSLVTGAAAASPGDPLDGFAGALADATSAPLALPVALLLLVAATTLPVMLAWSVGRAASDLLPGGRSSRLGAAAAALTAAAVALAVVAAGGSVGAVLTATAPIAGVVLAAWSGALTAAPLDDSSSSGTVRARGLLLVGVAVAVVVGLLLADGIGSTAERSPLLQLAGVAADSPIRAGSAAALVVTWLLAVAAGLLARVARQARARVAAAAS